MKLLLDENLSDRIVAQITDLFPDSTHVKLNALTHSDDTEVWNFAKENGYTIVSKDADFHQRSLVHGYPPKFVFLRIGNCSTSAVVRLLRSNSSLIESFESDSATSVLILS